MLVKGATRDLKVLSKLQNENLITARMINRIVRRMHQNNRTLIVSGLIMKLPFNFICLFRLLFRY